MKKILGSILVLAVVLIGISVSTVNVNGDVMSSHTSSGFLPENMIMPRSGTIEFTGERLEEYLRLMDIEDNNDVVKVVVSFIPSQSPDPVFENINPHFSSLEIRNVRTLSGDRIYNSTMRTDVLENFGNTTSSFSRTLSGTATSGFTSNVGISASGVTAGVGFSMNISRTESTTYNASVPARTRVTLESAVRAHEVSFDVWEVAWIGNSQTFRGTGTAHRPDGMWVRETHRSL